MDVVDSFTDVKERGKNVINIRLVLRQTNVSNFIGKVSVRTVLHYQIKVIDGLEASSLLMDEVINVADYILVLKASNLLGLLLHFVNVSDVTHLQSFEDELLLSLYSCSWT